MLQEFSAVNELHVGTGFPNLQIAEEAIIVENR